MLMLNLHSLSSLSKYTYLAFGFIAGLAFAVSVTVIEAPPCDRTAERVDWKLTQERFKAIGESVTRLEERLGVWQQ